MSNNLDKILELLGLARRANRLIIGQDDVFRQLNKNILLILLTSDPSKSVQNKIITKAKTNKHIVVTLQDIDREKMGISLGIRQVQVVALPLSDGFAKKILILNDRSDVDE